jgi:uncharacterized protein YbaR (Trm112 family)
MTENGQAANRKRDSRGATANDESPALEPRVLRLLACPLDGSAVSLDGSDLVCARCGRRYPVQNGIPNMLPHDAKSEHSF